MRFVWSLVLATAAVASAQGFAFNGRQGLKYNNKRPRGFAYTNATAVSNSSTTTTNSTSRAPSSLPGSSTGPWTSSSAAFFLNNTTDTPTCTGFVTYLGTVPPTVYITVTEGFDVTVTASNVSVTDTPTLITPLPACQATIIPGAIPGASNAPFIPANATGDPPDPPSPTRTGGFVPQIFTASLPQIATAGPDETATPQPFAPAATQATQATPIYTSAAYTSTVVVTKKTPVTVVAPSTTSPPVNFQSVSPASAPPPSPSKTQGSSTAPKPGGNNAPAGGHGATDSSSEGAPQASSTGGGVDTNGGSNQGSSGGNSNTGESSTSGANSNSGNTGEGSNSNGNTAGSGGGGDTNPTAKTNIVATSSLSTSNQAGAGHGTPVATTSTKLGLGNIIASILNSPFATPAPTASGAATPVPLTTTIDNVRVVVSSPNVVIIGSQTVAIPTVTPITVQANGAAFTVCPSEIVAPAGTITISRVNQNNVATTSVPVQTTTFITAVGDLTFTVGPTVAVLSGTTYRIGPNAPATTLTIDGTKVSIGSDGVGLPSTTIAPATVVTSPFVVYTTEGLTFSVDQSEAVVAGATYQIGSDASQATTTISGEIISFGPGGVGLDSTTIAPTAPPSETTTTLGNIRSTATTTSASHTAPSTTQSVTQTDSGGSALRLSLTEFGSWHLMAFILGLLVF